jgi:hypothetical protein
VTAAPLPPADKHCHNVFHRHLRFALVYGVQAAKWPVKYYLPSVLQIQDQLQTQRHRSSETFQQYLLRQQLSVQWLRWVYLVVLVQRYVAADWEEVWNREECISAHQLLVQGYQFHV